MRLQGLAGEENISSSFSFSGTKDSWIILHEKSTGGIVHAEENGNPLPEEKGSLWRNDMLFVQPMVTALSFSSALSVRKTNQPFLVLYLPAMYKAIMQWPLALNLIHECNYNFLVCDKF